MGQSTNKRILGGVSGIPADLAGSDDITDLARAREPGIENIERTPLSLIIPSCF